MKPEDMGTAGLQRWVNDSRDLDTFRDRRNRAEDIICQRLGTYAAMIFVEKLCDDKPAARRERMWREEHWLQTVRLARSWSVIVRADLLAGRPVSLSPARGYEQVLSMAFDMATNVCQYDSYIPISDQVSCGLDTPLRPGSPLMAL